LQERLYLSFAFLLLPEFDVDSGSYHTVGISFLFKDEFGNLKRFQPIENIEKKLIDDDLLQTLAE